MPSIKINIQHQLPQQEALIRVRGLLDKLKQEQQDKISNVKQEWKDGKGNFRFTTRGFDLSGVINVNPSSVQIDAKVPFAVSLFKIKIKEAIEKKARELLS
jgi:hypothetical protein